MPRFLIEGSCDGGLFAESVDADTQEEAERLAVERLCEAWGLDHSPDTTLDDLGDSASVTPYSRIDYIRDEAEALFEVLKAYVAETDNSAAECGDDASSISSAYVDARAILSRIPEDL